MFFQIFLDFWNQPIDLSPVMDFDEKLNIGCVWLLSKVDKQKAQCAASYKARYMSDTRLDQEIVFDLVSVRFGYTNISPGRKKVIHKKLRTSRGREETLVDFSEAV